MLQLVITKKKNLVFSSWLRIASSSGSLILAIINTAGTDLPFDLSMDLRVFPVRILGGNYQISQSLLFRVESFDEGQLFSLALTESQIDLLTVSASILFLWTIQWFLSLHIK